MYDQDRDKEAKARLQEIMNKYPVKQVDVARVTGKYRYTLTHLICRRHPPLEPEPLVAGQDQGPPSQDYRDHRELPRNLHVKQAAHEHATHFEALAAQVT